MGSKSTFLLTRFCSQLTFGTSIHQLAVAIENHTKQHGKLEQDDTHRRKLLEIKEHDIQPNRRYQYAAGSQVRDFSNGRDGFVHPQALAGLIEFDLQSTGLDGPTPHHPVV